MSSLLPNPYLASIITATCSLNTCPLQVHTVQSLSLILPQPRCCVLWWHLGLKRLSVLVWNGFCYWHAKSKVVNFEMNSVLKVHLTPKIFFAEIIRFILWSNVAQKFFKSVKSSNFYAPSKCVKLPPFWFATEFNGAWVEGRMWRQFENTMIL